MLYIRILEKILNEREVKRSQYAQLVRVCESTIQDIQTHLQEQQVPSKGLRVKADDDDGENNNVYESKLLPEEQNDISVDFEKYFLPFEMAIKGDSPKITILALDGVQKLIAHGHLTGNYPSSANPNKRLIDTIVESICSCFIATETDEGVELQIIKFQDLVAEPALFKENFRMSYHDFQILHEIVNEEISPKSHSRPDSFSSTEKLCITLEFLASGSLQRHIASIYRASKQALGPTIETTCDAIIKKLHPLCLQENTSFNWLQASNQYHAHWNFPNVCGSIDGKHVGIKCPGNAGSLFYNYKALLTIVTSQYVQIHEGSVLLTLRTCFNIYLLTKSSINQTTSRAMMLQFLSNIFSRMEMAYQDLPAELLSKIDSDVNMTPARLDEVTNAVEDWNKESIAWFNHMDLSSFFYPVSQTLIPTSSEKGLEDSSGMINHALEENTAGITNEQHVKCNADHDNLHHSPEIVELSNAENITQTSPTHVEKSSYPSILQKDAFLVFWAVCKLATKPSLSEELESDTRRPLEQKSTILSFQLLKSVLQNSGTVFQSSSMFHTAIKQYLCTALNATGVSSIQDVYQLNLDLLIILIDKFREAIVDDVEKLMDDILFPVLEKPTMFTNEYKLLALGSMNRIYNNFTSLVDFISNQETEENGIFKRMINYTCKLTDSEKYVGDSGSLSTLPIRVLAVESITSLLHKMADCLNKKNENASQSNELLPTFTAQQINENDDLSNQTFENRSHSFISALFTFLETLPESFDVLKVDLIIQTSAQELFDQDNFGGNLESADGIYALMYASIGLIGELSSKQGRRRVSKEGFIKFNQSTTSIWYQKLPSEFLGLVFNEIDAYLKRQAKHRKQLSTTSVQWQSLNVMHNAKKLIKNVGLQLHHPAFLYEKQVRCVKKMFKIMGKPVLNALMGTLILYDDATVTDVCLSGLQYSIHISSVLNLKNERDAFVQALSRLSLAALKEIKDKTANALVVTSKTSSTTTTENGIQRTTITTTTETKCRNIDIILTLLNVANDEGNYLNQSWLDLLKCISQLEASELMRKNCESRTSSPTVNVDNEAKSWYAWAGSLVPTLWDNSGSKLDIASVKQSMATNVNKIFLNSTKLDENGIVEFFKALCQVSLIEITHPENPRSFVFEKIFEVAHLNIHRPCLQWCGIWQVLKDYFCHLACSSDEDVSFFAIDSITKLVVHLLGKETFGNFRFQNYFLKPYETIMQNTPFVSTREYVLEAIAKIVRTSASHLRSGWIPIFRMLESSVFHDATNTAEVSFSMIKGVIDLFTEAEVNLQSSYQDLLRCLMDLSFKGPTQHVQTESLKLLQKLASLVHTRPELFLALESLNRHPLQLWNFGWHPIFKELSSVVINSSLDSETLTQANALTILFELVKEYGGSFHTSWWQSLFAILFAIFNKLKFHGEDAILADANLKSSQNLSKGYNKFYCYYYVQFAIIDTFIHQYDILGGILMDTLLKELEWCIRQGHDQIALSGVQCIHQLVRMCQNKICIPEWTLITNLLQDLLQITSVQDKQHIWNSVIQLELLKVVKTILIPTFEDDAIHADNTKTYSDSESYPTPNDAIKDIRISVGDRNIFLLLDTIETRISMIVTSHEGMNENSSHGSSKDSDLQLQETLLMDMYLRFLVQMYFRQSWSNDEIDKIETRFTTGVTKVLSCFVSVQPITPNHLHDLTDVMVTCIQSLHHKVSQEKFLSFANIFYPKLCDLLELDLESTLSTALARYFLAVIRLKIGDKSNL